MAFVSSDEFQRHSWTITADAKEQDSVPGGQRLVRTILIPREHHRASEESHAWVADAFREWERHYDRLPLTAFFRGNKAPYDERSASALSALLDKARENTGNLLSGV
jgi:hypothetical protein